MYYLLSEFTIVKHIEMNININPVVPIQHILRSIPNPNKNAPNIANVIFLIVLFFTLKSPLIF